MARNVFSKAMRVGKAGALAVGLAVMLATVLGVATQAMGATGGNFILGKANVATTVSKLTASIAGPALTLVNNSTGAAATALNISVAEGKAPLKVNAAAGTATNLSADKLDGKDSDQFAAGVGGKAADAFNADRAVTAADAEKLDGKDSGAFATGTNGKADNAAHADQADSAASAQNAQNADTLDNKDSADFMAAALPSVRVGLQHQQGVGSGTQYTPVGFSKEDFDQVGGGQGGEMHAAANNSRLVAPRAGIYQVDVQIGWVANGPNDGLRSAGVVMNQNGACNMVDSLAFDRLAVPGGEAAYYNHMSTLVAMNQGDYLEVCVNHNTSVERWLSDRFTSASMHYVSGR